MAVRPLALALLAVLALPLAAQSPAAKGADAKALLKARTKGSATAPVTVYEMSDFQCPYCREFALKTYASLEQKYVATGKVRWVFVHLPLTSIHKNAAPAAELSMCAAEQDKFWPMHDVLFRTQNRWKDLKEPAAFFLTLADSIGADRKALRACAASGRMSGEVETDATGAARAGATSTPTFYIEGGLLLGAQPVPVFTQILDSILAAKAAKK